MPPIHREFILRPLVDAPNHRDRTDAFSLEELHGFSSISKLPAPLVLHFGAIVK